MQRFGTKHNVDGAHASRIRVRSCPNLISRALERERVWIPEDGHLTAQTYAAIFCTDSFDMCCRLEGMWGAFAGPSPCG